MDTNNSYDQWIGMEAVDRQGDKLGKVDEIFYDDVSGRPEWLKVKAGTFKGSRLVPLAGAQYVAKGENDDDDDNQLMLGVTKEQIEGAPEFDVDRHLGADDERKLYAHYGFNWDQRDTTHFGYGEHWNAERFDTKYPKREVGRIGNIGTEQDARTETVPIHTTAQVEVPVDAQVRLRRYETETQHTETRQVQVPVTETEEHVEVADVQATARPQGGTTRGVRSK
jgi:hypothetical protein